MKQVIIFCLIALMLMPYQAVGAVSREDFDPNFIISDEELTYWQSMDLGAIDRFLKSKDGYISTLTIEDTDGVRKPVAEIIYDTAKKYQINPKYLIVKLQKEQSLVTDKDPTQKQLDWATGYGVCDSCAMDDPRIQKFKGFGNQVDYAAGIMRWYYDNVDRQAFIKRPGTTYAISGQSVRPATLATAFLYTYTPHIQGNQNFWLLWNTWFESRFPSGTLIKGETNPEIYLLENGQKRHFKNYSALITRFDPKFVVTVPDAELADYPDGPSISLPNYAVLQQGSNFYLLDYDTLRPFASAAVVRDLGYNPEEIIEVTSTDLSGYTRGNTITASTNPIGELVYVSEINSYFFVKDGMYETIVDTRLIPINYSHLTPVTRPLSYIESLTRGPDATIKNGVIFGIEGFNQIYVMEHGQKRHISNPAVFEGMGYRWENIQWVTPITGTVIPTGIPLDSAPNRERASGDAESFESANVDIVTASGGSPITSDNTIAHDEPAPAKTNGENPIDYFVRTPLEAQSSIGPLYTTDIESYVVYDVEAETIVAGKNVDAVRQPASLQKVLTAVLLDELDIDLTAATTYEAADHRGLYHRYRVVEGETIQHAHLLDAFLVSSLNTPGRMLVDSVMPDESAFISQMNTQVSKWGLTNTSVVDVTGERVANQTTAREYLTIFLRAIERDLVSEYLSKRSYAYTALRDLDGKPNHSDVHSNELVRKSGLPYTIQESKTGFLWESGGNLAMRVTRNSDGKSFVIITLGNPNFDDRFTETDNLARWVMRSF